MCKDCDNGMPDFNGMTFEDVFRMLAGKSPAKPKSEEEEIREITDELERTKAKVVKSVPVDSAVTVHFLPGYSEHGDSVVKLVTELQRNYPAPGKVDVYFPGGESGPVMTKSGLAESQAATSNWLNGKLDFAGKDRVVIIGKNAFQPGKDKAAAGWHMPVYDNSLVNEWSYVITHEWGHVIDVRPVSDEYAKQLENKMRTAGLIDYRGVPTYQMRSSMSEYGLSGESETYAESFAEWAVSNGATDNFGANWYAKEYDWPKLPVGIHYAHRRTPRNDNAYKAYDSDSDYRSYDNGTDYSYPSYSDYGYTDRGYSY